MREKNRKCHEKYSSRKIIEKSYGKSKKSKNRKNRFFDFSTFFDHPTSKSQIFEKSQKRYMRVVYERHTVRLVIETKPFAGQSFDPIELKI